MRFHKQTTKAFRNYLLAKYARLTGKTTITSLPYLLFIDPSSCCNLRCPMCVEDGNGLEPPQRKRPSALMSPTLFKRLMDELGPYLFMVSLYNWGEPLLNRHLPEFIRLAKSYDIYVDLNTNLSLDLSDLQLSEFLQSGVDNVVISIDGFSQASYGTYRLGGSFELAKDNVTRLALLRDKLGLATEITWKFLLFSFNEHEVELAREYCQTIGITFAAKDAIIDLAKHPEWLPRHRADESSREHPGWPISRYYEPSIKAAGKENTCAWHYYYSAVNADGTVSPCCAVDKVSEDFGPLDDDHSFLEFWNNDRFRSARGVLASSVGSKGAGESTICHRCPYLFLKDICSGTNKQVVDNFSASAVQDPLTAEGFKLLGEPVAFSDFMEKNMAQFVANADGVTAPQRDRGFTAGGIEPSICTVCGKDVVFASKRDDFSLRETHCPECKASQRTRDLARVILDTFGGCRSLTDSLPALHQMSIYEASATGPLHELLRSLPGYVCSEYYDDVALGANSSAGVRCEDLERLTFPAASFDLVITQDVFEHIANPWQAFAEIERVLKIGGSHIFTVPLHEGSNTVRRARPDQGKTDFLLPPVYHGDPLRPAGTLVYTDFGDDLGGLLNKLGFTTDIAHQSTFYDISQIPLILEDASYRRYLERRQRGEMLAFFLYNAGVFRSEKSGERPGAPVAITIPPLELAPEQLVLTGELAFEAGQLEAARSLFAQALERAPGDSDALNDVGALAYRDGNLAEAESFFYQAIDRKADNWAARTNLADLYSLIPDLAKQEESHRAFCPCCNGSFPQFISGGPNLRPNACCPRCGSLERHRLLWLYLQQKTNLFSERLKVLHVAPERIYQDAFKSLPNLDYLSADIASPLAMVKMDITAIDYPEASFDVIFCNHVLEHIPDDRLAMRELYRVLNPGGWAILQVPIDLSRAVTYEDPTIVTPEERERHFGQDDHVRWYGADYGARLAEAGFKVTVDDFAAGFDNATAERCGIIRGEDIYLCRKVGAPPIPPDRLRFMNETPEQFLAIGDSLVRDLTHLAGFKDTSRILDIGSGYGRLAHSIMRGGSFHGEYCGLEILKLHSEWCRDQLGSLDSRFHFVHLDVRNDRYNPGGKFNANEVVFPYADASFDLICLTSVFTHMYEEEIRHYLLEIGRLLAEGGRCYATFFLLTDESRRLIEEGKSTIDLKLPLNDHCRYLNPDDPLHAIGYVQGWLQRLVDSCGLKTEKVAHGSWCGRKTDNIYQDVLVISRAPAAKDKHAERKGIK